MDIIICIILAMIGIGMACGNIIENGVTDSQKRS